MKKHVNRGISLIIAMLMALTMMIGTGMTVLADETEYTLTIGNSGKTDHTVQIYQIFTGDVADAMIEVDSKKVAAKSLSNVAWGSGISDAGKVALIKQLKLAETAKAADVAKALEKLYGKDDELRTISDLLATSTNLGTVTKINNKEEVTITAGTTKKVMLPGGYYFINDQAGSQDNKENGAYTRYILQVVGDTSVNTKLDVPSVEKKVKENVKKVTNPEGIYEEPYNDVADYNMGDSVPFELIGTVPNMDAFKTYKTFTFTDTLSTGLTAPDVKDIKVYASTTKSATSDDNEITKLFDISVSGQVITVALHDDTDDTKDVDLKTLTYGTDETKLKTGDFIIVKYEAVLNQKAVVGLDGNENTVYLTYSSNPNQVENGDTNQTPEDKVIVFTYELDINKIDGETKKSLEGVQFKLYRMNGTTKEWVKLEAGSNKVTGWDSNEDNGSKVKTGSDGLARIIGLDDGTYFLSETDPIEGYNKIADIELTITAKTINDQKWSGTSAPSKAFEQKTDEDTKEEKIADDVLTIKVGSVTKNGTISDGIVKMDVENNKGAILPSTGGIGTTIFYVIGGILVLGAGVTLVTRRRMSR